MANLTRRRMIKLALATGAAAAGGAALLLPRKANAYYSGPVSDHFDGERFFNPGGRYPQSASRLWHLYMKETWAKWPTEVPAPEPDQPPAMVDQGVRIAFVGHASWLIQTEGLNILVDPVWSERASPYSFAGPRRSNAPGVSFERLPKIHAVLVTHNHYDHLDLATLARLWSLGQPRIVTPLGNDVIMRPAMPGLRASVLDWRQSIELSPRVRVHAEPTQHWSARGLRDRRHALWASFVIETPSSRIYAVGDSGFGDGRTFREVRERHPKIDMALLPIGAYEPRWFMQDQHMNPADAVAAFELCGAARALGHHWGTFQLTTEPHNAPELDLAVAMSQRSIPAERFRAAKPGMVWQYRG